MLAEAHADASADELEPDGHEQQDHLPLDRQLAHHAPDVAGQAEEHERREAPDVFLGTGLAEAAAGEAASHGERHRAPFAGEEARAARWLPPTIAPV